MQLMVATITLLVIVMGCPSYSEAQADESKLISYCYTTGHYNSSIIANVTQSGYVRCLHCQNPEHICMYVVALQYIYVALLRLCGWSLV